MFLEVLRTSYLNTWQPEWAEAAFSITTSFAEATNFVRAPVNESDFKNLRMHAGKANQIWDFQLPQTIT